MDVVAVSVATGVAKALAEPQHAAPLLSKLDQDQVDAVLGVLGDSTGNGTDEWVYLLAQHLAGRYPRYTVTYRLWNDGTQLYDSPSTIQTGTGTHTLAVYNGSTSGMTHGYSSTRILLQLPVAPDLVIINYGHNNIGTTAFRPNIYNLLRPLSDYWPRANIIQTAQNTRWLVDTDYTQDLQRQQQIIESAAAENTGLINVTQRFLDYGTARDVDLMTDTVHPNAAGQAIWIDEVKKHFRRAPQMSSRGPIARATRVWVPAIQFIGGQGTPDLALRGSTYPAWTLDKDTQESLVAVVDLPSTWGSANLWVLWTTAGGSTNSVRWQLGHSYLSQQPSGTNPGFTPSGFAVDGTVTDPAYTNALQNRIVAIRSDIAYAGRPIALEITRLAADAADTLAQDAWFTGLLIERAS